MGIRVQTAAGFFATAIAFGLGAGAAVGQPVAVVNNSILGIDATNNPFCSYFAPDGSLTSVFIGTPRYGTWSADGNLICETIDGQTTCNDVEYVPPSYQVARMILQEGTGSFSYLGAIRPGDQCMIAGIPTVPDKESFPGLLAHEASFTDAQGAQLGAYVDQGNGAWAETNTAGAVTFSFVEAGRDDGIVYLEDRSRNVAIQLDLYLRQVMYASPIGGQVSPLYMIGDFR